MGDVTGEGCGTLPKIITYKTHQNYEMQGKNKRIGLMVFDEYLNRNHKIKAQAFLINFHCKLYIMRCNNQLLQN